MRGVSPRARNDLPPDVLASLLDAQARAAEAQEEFRAAVVAALEHGSVRVVAAALGMSPTTVMAWKAER